MGDIFDLNILYACMDFSKNKLILKCKIIIINNDKVIK